MAEGEQKTYTADEVQELVKAELAKAKAEGDTAFKSLWQEAKDAKARLREFEGVDPKEYTTLRAKVQELEQKKKAEKAGITGEELERLRTEVRQDLEKEYAPSRTRLETLESENRTLKLDNVVKATMAKSGVLPNRLDALFRLTNDHYDLTDDGLPMVKDRPGTPVDKFIVDDLRKEYPEFFMGTGSSGGGAAKSSHAGGVGKTVVPLGDNAAFIANLDRIAKGEAEVR